MRSSAFGSSDVREQISLGGWGERLNTRRGECHCFGDLQEGFYVFSCSRAAPERQCWIPVTHCLLLFCTIRPTPHRQRYKTLSPLTYFLCLCIFFVSLPYSIQCAITRVFLFQENYNARKYAFTLASTYTYEKTNGYARLFIHIRLTKKLPLNITCWLHLNSYFPVYWEVSELQYCVKVLKLEPFIYLYFASNEPDFLLKYKVVSEGLSFSLDISWFVRPQWGAIKHDGGSAMGWGCSGLGDLVIIINAEKQHQIWSRHAIPPGNRTITISFIFRHENEPKHTGIAVKAQWVTSTELGAQHYCCASCCAEE